jgi:hypothetical protein
MYKKLLVLLFCLGLATAANADLIALYEFEGNFSDSTGTQPDGVPNGSPGLIVDGERGNVLSVSPDNNVDCGVVTNSSVTDLTVGLWVMTTQDVGASRSPLTSSYDCYQEEPGWGLMMRNDSGWLGPNNIWWNVTGGPPDGAWDGGYLFVHNDDPLKEPPDEDPIFTYGEWIHLALTFDDTSRVMKGYVNGQFHAEKTITEATRAVGSDVEHLILGGQYEFFTGSFDDVFIADHAMTLGEIQAISGIPEPATIALLGLGGLALLRLRKKH